MHGGDDADEKIQAHVVPFLKRRGERLAAHTRDAQLAVGLVDEPIVEIVEELAVNAHWLHTVQHRVARPFQHQFTGITRVRTTSIRVTGASPVRSATSILSMTSIPSTTRPN